MFNEIKIFVLGMESLILHPMSEFMRRNIVYFNWKPPPAEQAPSFGRQSGKFHLTKEKRPWNCCPHFFSDPYKDYYNLCWMLMIPKDCSRQQKKCSPSERCLLLECRTACLGAFRISFTLCFENSLNKLFDYRHYEFWITGKLQRFHNILPHADDWTKIHVFLEFVPNVYRGDGEAVLSDQTPEPPLTLFLSDSDVDEPPYKYLRSIYAQRNDEDQDCVTLVSGVDHKRKTIKIHREIFKRSSLVFEKMLESGMKESRSDEVVLEDMSQPLLEQIVHYLYLGYFRRDVHLDLHDYVNLCMFFVEHELPRTFYELKQFISCVVPNGPLNDLREWVGFLNWLADHNFYVFPHNFYNAFVRINHLYLYLTETVEAIEESNKFYDTLRPNVKADFKARIIKQACVHSIEDDTPLTDDFHCSLRR